MAILSTQTISPSGLAATYSSAAGGGDKLRGGDRVFLHVKNDGGASITVTVNDVGSVSPDGAASFNPDLSVVVLASGESFIGPIRENRFRGDDGYADVTYSGVSSVTVAVLRV